MFSLEWFIYFGFLFNANAKDTECVPCAMRIEFVIIVVFGANLSDGHYSAIRRHADCYESETYRISISYLFTPSSLGVLIIIILFS